MIYIRTGKPGHGKTLNTIREIDEKAFAESRVVYYHNIPELKTDKLKASWFEFEDPYKWFELPNDAIIVIDEAQGWFGVRDPRQKPPEHVSRFELIRHQGHEMHLVTQDPRFIDVHIRRLANGHIHFWRVFKSQQLLRFESDTVIDAVEKKTSFKDADKTTIKLDKKYFGMYRSTQGKHHFKVQLPKKFIAACVVLVVAAFLVYRAYERYQEEQQQAAAEEAAPAPGASSGVVDSVTDKVGSILNPISAGGGGQGKVLTEAQYLDLRKPRVPDVPASAPIYDELTKPVAYPKPFCLSSRDEELVRRNALKMSIGYRDGRLYGCRCNSQQGTRMLISFDACMNYVENGAFDPAIPDRSIDQRMVQSQAPASQQFQVQSVQPRGEAGPRVTVVPDTSRLPRTL
ncbi:TPA: zonular occludens toxin [Pseudomonas aeruginosa]|nr:zonular occludens toxin [Pseudomonas aeruginosa]HCE7345953.1 zonular occludens toxin [Pseudomonas aeruginosa]HCE7931637.1 zonular occludens toxin [Pseudomonas aeruginosa]HCE9435930.1 zonular occludens toxin [Pseudomonas aeruginosa]HCF3185755.1 zonular occludens toxin [Pseudomonas aeruginosa]